MQLQKKERKKYICKPGQARNISIKLDEKYSSHFISYFFITFSSRFIFEMGKTSTTYQTRKQNTNSSSHRDTHELPSLPESLNVCLQLQLLRRSAVSQAGNIPQDFSRRLWGDNRRRGTLTLGTSFLFTGCRLGTSMGEWQVLFENSPGLWWRYRLCGPEGRGYISVEAKAIAEALVPVVVPTLTALAVTNAYMWKFVCVLVSAHMYMRVYVCTYVCVRVRNMYIQ